MFVAAFICVLVMFLIGLILNTAAILFISTQKRRFILKDQLTLSLCGSNILQLLIGYTTELDALYTGKLNVISCTAASFMMFLCSYSAIIHYVLLSLERYVSIVRPYTAAQWFKRYWVKRLFLTIGWLYGLLWAIPPLFGLHSYAKIQTNSIQCTLVYAKRSSTAATVYYYGIFVLALFVPGTVMILFYVLIIAELRKAKKKAVHRSGRLSVVSIASGKNITIQKIIVCSLLTLYMISWLPFTLISLFHYNVTMTIECLAIYLAKSSTIWSPLIFCVLEKKFCNYLCYNHRDSLRDRRRWSGRREQFARQRFPGQRKSTISNRSSINFQVGLIVY